MKDRVIAIIQARINSTRLPGKVFLPLAGKSAIEHVIMRVKKSEKVSEVVVATSVNKCDSKIVEFCGGMGIRVFRGSEEDVLDRFYRASGPLKTGHVVRVTADCPAIDPKVIDNIIVKHLEKGVDYTSNTIEPTYPDGEDVEVFKVDALEEAWKNAKLSSEREHVTPYITKNPQIFKLLNVTYKTDLSKKRWTLDEERDYMFLGKIFDNLYPLDPFFGIEDVLRFLEENPGVEEINSGIKRNEWYQKSLKNDRIVSDG
jgi:spore coat polysaccharide biosynthesis protein SpsF